jgi:RimJ/RimL family protein N-acetyltransferase
MHALATARLHLRPLMQADEALYRRLYTDADTMRHVGKPWSPERAARSFRRALAWSDDAASDPQFLAMIETSTQHAIGLCGVHPFDAAGRRAEVGILLVSESCRRGYASEGLAALVSHAFSALPIDTVWAQYHSQNVAAEQLFIGLGFLPQTDGEFGDECDGQRFRHVHRSIWCSPTLQNQRGEGACRT